MSGVGYGDITPYKNREFVYQWACDLCGAYGIAVLTGFIATYFADKDANGEASFKKKVADINTYIHFRQLEPSLKAAVLAHYSYIWHKLRSISTNRNEIVSSLSKSLAMDVCLHLQADILEKVPLLAETAYPLKRRIALALRPQV